MRVLLRTLLLLPLLPGIALVLLLAISLRVMCRDLMRERPCAAL